jgi:hypothetical protein
MPQGFADHLEAVAGPYGRQEMGRVRALAPPGLDQLAFAASREPQLEQEGRCRAGDEAGATLAEPRGLAPRVGERQAPNVWPIDATAPGMCRLAVGEPLGELEHGDQRQPPRGARGLSVCREERQKGVIRAQGLPRIGPSQVPVALRKGRAGDPGRLRGDGLDRQRAKQRAPPVYARDRRDAEGSSQALHDFASSIKIAQDPQCGPNALDRINDGGPGRVFECEPTAQ